MGRASRGKWRHRAERLKAMTLLERINKIAQQVRLGHLRWRNLVYAAHGPVKG